MSLVDEERRLGAALAEARARGMPARNLRLRQAEVLAVTGVTATITLGGSSAPIAGVSVLGTGVTTGDIVFVLQNGTDLLVLGGTGSTGSSLVVSVKAYGARGDGVTDDTAAINNAIVAASAAGSATRQVRVVFPDGTYQSDGIAAKANVWLDFAGATIRKRSNGTSVATNSLLRAAPVLIGATYYGTYKNMRVTGGRFDPNGFTCPAHVINLIYCEDLQMSDVTVAHHAANASWAFCLGGRRLVLSGLNVTGGTALFQDGVHILHGQDVSITGGVVASGDDAIALGGEPTDTYLSADPDPIRRVTVAGVVTTPARAACVKMYVASGAPDNANWEITDVVVTGVTGGAKGSAPIAIRDINNRAAGSGRIRRVKVKDFTLFVGDSPTVASSAFPGTPYGVYLQSADFVDIDGQIEFRGDNTAPSGWRLAFCEDALALTLRLACQALTSGGGLDLVDCVNARIHDSYVRGSNDCNAPLLRVNACPGLELVDNVLIDQRTGFSVIEVIGGTTTTLRLAGGRLAHVAGATGGIGVNYGSVTFIAAVDISGVDMSGCFQRVPTSFWQLLHREKRPSIAFGSAGVLAALPAAGVNYRGKQVWCEGGAGVADQVYICRKNAADAYEWAPLA